MKPACSCPLYATSFRPPLITCLICSTFSAVYRRQFRQSRGGPVINPSRSQRNNVAREISNISQTSLVLYNFLLGTSLTFFTNRLKRRYSSHVSSPRN